MLRHAGGNPLREDFETRDTLTPFGSVNGVISITVTLSRPGRAVGGLSPYDSCAGRGDEKGTSAGSYEILLRDRVPSSRPGC